MYSRLIQELVDDVKEQDRLFKGLETMPEVRAKAEWCIKWIEDRTQPFAARLVAFAAVEGIFFSSSFAAIFWLKSRGMMPGLCQANELISRDEGLHTNFACLLHGSLVQPAPATVIYTIIREAVQLEQAFFAGE